jgi:hypothetical protein
MKQWLLKILDKRINRFIFILIGFIFGFSIVFGTLYLIVIISIKNGMIAYIGFCFIVWVIIAILLSKKRIIF